MDDLVKLGGLVAEVRLRIRNKTYTIGFRVVDGGEWVDSTATRLAIAVREALERATVFLVRAGSVVMMTPKKGARSLGAYVKHRRENVLQVDAMTGAALTLTWNGSFWVDGEGAEWRVTL